MAAITKIEFWKDVGFLEGAIEIPRLDAPDPVNPDLTIEPDQPIIPSKERFFTKLKVREYFDELMEMSYIRLTYELNDKTMIFYGWVRDISLESDGDLPMTVIDWHIDEWRTWKSAVTFGSGHVKRRPFRDLASTPIQEYPIRFVEVGSTAIKILDPLVVDSREFWWIIVSANYSTGVGETRIVTLCFPVRCDTVSGDTYYYVKDYASDPPTYATKKARAYSLYSIYGGLLDEMIADVLGSAPESINGVWVSPISPVCPDAATGRGTNADPLDFGVELFCQYAQLSGEPGVFNDGNLGVVSYRYENIPVRTKTFSPITSDEQHRYVLTDTNGTKILELPYGFTVSSVTVTLIIEPDGPYFEISFKDSSYGGLEGLTVNIPLTELPMNSNSYNSYVYSGKQDYDREMRTIRSNADAWKSSAANGSTGALFGAVGPIGAAAGLAAGVAPGLISYGVEMLYQNDAEQHLENKLQANQTSTLILTSNSLMAMIRRYSFVIKDIVPDDYSAQQIIATRNQFGISVDELMSSCDSLIRSTSPTGYYNIQNMIVNGNIPVSAKKWIREKFRSGVRLI